MWQEFENSNFYDKRVKNLQENISKANPMYKNNIHPYQVVIPGM